MRFETEMIEMKLRTEMVETGLGIKMAETTILRWPRRDLRPK